jgi:hypothetical protein
MQAAADFARRANQLTGFECGTSSAGLKVQRESLRQTANFVSRFKLIRAAGPSSQKIFVYENQKLCMMGASRSRKGGASRSSRNVGRDAMDVLAQLTNAADTDGEGVWS